MKRVKFIDLFSGIGGIRLGFEQACVEFGYIPQCVFSSEIKEHALNVLRQNHPNENVCGDITKIDASNIPDFDFLLAGFPCQAFSYAGKRKGFADTRGTLFFEVERILKEKKPKGFLLENVEGLVTHDKANPKDDIGRTLQTILDRLLQLDYKVSWKVLNAKNFGVPQERKRIYIVGTKEKAPKMDSFVEQHCMLEDVLEHGLPTSKSTFVKKLLSCYDIDELPGRSIKDKRGGEDNIHSWDIGLKGSLTVKQKKLLNSLLTERRKKKWAQEIGIDWMDGMPLTLDQIREFFDDANLASIMDDLVAKGYVKFEYPKKLIIENGVSRREPDKSKPKGYNIVTGKMSFEINKILSPKEIAPTLVAMDMQHLYVVDGKGLRSLSLREGLRLFGYPDDYKFDVKENLGYDLLGNTVVVKVIKSVANRLLEASYGEDCK